eukprot:2645722-Prymnesium_polylepis.1
MQLAASARELCEATEHRGENGMERPTIYMPFSTRRSPLVWAAHVTTAFIAGGAARAGGAGGKP